MRGPAQRLKVSFGEHVAVHAEGHVGRLFDLGCSDVLPVCMEVHQDAEGDSDELCEIGGGVVWHEAFSQLRMLLNNS
ncbi:hypothetical protein [Deinococcus sp. RM]|uniref:hypothetical protein n=1 Tax=Deinococcus sp. RM TaxID=2316359 RepID=UPI0011C2178C|nr:hypothetical protein [Deinococcus sp. RM]